MGEVSPLLTALYALMLLTVLVPLLDMLLHARAIPSITEVTGPESGRANRLPRLSVIVPARNEEAAVRNAVASMIAQDYPDLEVLLVDDRSTDSTGAIMADLARARPGRVRFTRVESLPDGWLGKNHALYTGAAQATGEWLLFADADVHFAPTCFRRAVFHAERTGLDHLTMLPVMRTTGYWLNAFICFFIYGFLVYQRPYRANNPRSKNGIGVGAFNLIRRQAYRQIGTHRAISLRPDDDLRLGLRVKRAGLRQQVVDGGGLMGLEWYTHLGAAVAGLEKNLFAGLEYNLLLVFGSLASLFLLCVYPYAALLWSRGSHLWLIGATVLVNTASFIAANYRTNPRAYIYAPAFPILALIFLFTVGRSAFLALRQGGIRWRGTLYSLKELRRQSGLENIARE